MPAWHRVDAYPRLLRNGRDHAGEPFGTLIPRVEAYVFLDVISQGNALGLHIADTGHRVDGEDVYRYAAQYRVLRHGIGQHVATDPAPAPAHQVHLGGQTRLAEHADDALLQLLRGWAALTVVVGAPEPGGCRSGIRDGYAGIFQALVFLLAEFGALPVAFAFDYLKHMVDVFFPAAAKQLAGPVEIAAGLDEQVVILEVAAAGAVNGDPVGEFAALVVTGQGRDQFTVPEVGVGVVEAVGAGAAEVSGEDTHM
ncbi:hypothetical protein D3C79_758240 [compost metagenome]